MNTKQQCNECKQWRIAGTAACTCGKKSITLARADYRCSYQNQEQRCYQQGTVSLQLRGNTWYCRQHLQQVRREIEKSYQSFKENIR